MSITSGAIINNIKAAVSYLAKESFLGTAVTFLCGCVVERSRTPTISALAIDLVRALLGASSGR